MMEPFCSINHIWLQILKTSVFFFRSSLHLCFSFLTCSESLSVGLAES